MAAAASDLMMFLIIEMLFVVVMVVTGVSARIGLEFCMPMFNGAPVRATSSILQESRNEGVSYGKKFYKNENVRQRELVVNLLNYEKCKISRQNCTTNETKFT
jgi:hypothetical protein